MKKSDLMIWYWLIENHPEAIDVEWSYYGSGFERQGRDVITLDEIDFDSMEPLQSINESGFDGTFVDSRNIDTIQGELILKSGEKYDVGFVISTQEMLNVIVDYMAEKIG